MEIREVFTQAQSGVVIYIRQTKPTPIKETGRQTIKES